jgi:hypothetical protein
MHNSSKFGKYREYPVATRSRQIFKEVSIIFAATALSSIKSEGGVA